MKKIIITAAAIISMTFAGCAAVTGGSETSYKQISQSEAAQMMMAETDHIIVDVRTEAEYAEGHIPGAICIPNETIDENIINMLPKKDQTILIYCRSGNRSKQASQKLANLGYTAVYEFGGINTWSGEVVK